MGNYYPRSQLFHKTKTFIMGMVRIPGSYEFKQVIAKSEVQTKKYEKRFFKVYFNALSLLLELTDTQKNIILLACEHMSDDNVIAIGPYFFKVMNDMLIANGSIKEALKPNTLYKAIMGLRDKDILKKIKNIY